jgi:hypothetical protein
VSEFDNKVSELDDKVSEFDNKVSEFTLKTVPKYKYKYKRLFSLEAKGVNLLLSPLERNQPSGPSNEAAANRAAIASKAPFSLLMGLWVHRA